MDGLYVYTSESMLAIKQFVSRIYRLANLFDLNNRACRLVFL